MCHSNSCRTVGLLQIPTDKSLGVMLLVANPGKDQKARRIDGTKLAVYRGGISGTITDHAHRPSASRPKIELHMRSSKPALCGPPLKEFVGIRQRRKDSFCGSLYGDFLYDRVFGCRCRVHCFSSMYFFRLFRDSPQNIS